MRVEGGKKYGIEPNSLLHAQDTGVWWEWWEWGEGGEGGGKGRLTSKDEVCFPRRQLCLSSAGPSAVPARC